ncbi:hypothetical protein G6514_007977 [Epicoccum nigrum]|nr:hypothetical protein G6514_007977 [Epicoccum nigrum]
MSTTASSAATVPPKPRAKLLSALRRSDSYDSSESSADSASDGSDVESVTTKSLYKPQAQHRSPTPAVEEDEVEVDAESAYQRMRRRLAAEKVSQEHEAHKPTPVPATAIESEDDDDTMPVQKPARRHASTRQRSSSPRTSRSPNLQSRQSSPGLFVSPGPSPVKRRAPASPANGSDSDHSSHRASTTDLQERVRRIRAERLAKQKEEAEKMPLYKASGRASGAGAGSDDEAEVDRRLTQQSKPTRRAGKKALEAMARDQQRISRNMQLAHQAKTKKKYSTKDLFAKFGFNAPSDDTTTGPPTPELAAALASSDVDALSTNDTPPTSPTQQDDNFDKTNVNSVQTTPRATVVSEVDDVTPALTKVDKGKGRAPEFAHLPTRSWPTQRQVVTVRQAQIQSAKPIDDAMVELSDSDDESKITPKSRFAVFDRIRTKEQDESKSFVTLRHLAHLTSSKTSRKGPKTISRNEMNFGLAQKARLQAQRSREEKIEELKRRGVHIETAEEREKHQMEVEDLVAQFEKQRQEDLKLAKLEKKEAKANGQTIDELPSSDEDEDYVGSDEEIVAEDGDEEQEEGAEDDLELSGSEDEQMEDADASNDLIDGAAEEDADAELEDARTVLVNDLTENDDDESVPLARKPTSKRARRVVDDEDESSDEAHQLGSPTQEATQIDAKSAFGFGVADPGLGLTQMFAGSMANLDDLQATSQEPEQDSLDFLRSFPDTQPPGVTFSQTHDTLVPNSQLFVSPRKASQPGVESQFSLNIGQLVAPSPSRTQFSEAPEPTQDVGFSFSRSPAGFKVPDSTIETVMMTVAESPLKQRAGRLQRGRREATVELSDVEEPLDDGNSDLSDVDDIQRPPKHRDAFRAMHKGAKKQKAIADFNKKNSAAKDIVEEQADESEDEYAGIGGASDDDSGEEDEDLKKMIDHADVKVDERKIAAFYAEKDKKDDEKNINQLYKDIMNGGLRKRAGRDAFDMSDSEDEAEMRQRRKRADFARMQKALMSDENIGKIAENPKQQAFFKTLADFADDAEYDFLEMPEPKSIYAEESQSQSQSQQQEDDGTEEADLVVPDSQNDMLPPNPLKRKSPSSSQKENRPPPNIRRTDNGLARRPITLADVQNSVQELLEDSRVVVPDSQYVSDSDSELEVVDKPVRKTVVDRLTLSRQSTIESSQDSAGGMAFHAPSRGPALPGFKVPSLIRQATSNLSATSERSEARTSQGSEGSVRRGGTGRSNIHAQAREAERRALLEKSEKRRKEVLKKKVDGARRKGGMRSVLGDLSAGFE